jgi:tyrosyl-tRNA synthetase
MAKFVSFEGANAAVFVNNADWLDGLNYINFLRDIGVYFSVNRMIKAECFKTRMEKGLSFLEFNYMLMQAYDFLHLYQKYGICLQCGGDDQWSNILEGADLIRRKEKKPAFAVTFTLLTTSAGEKMGKTQKGAVWLDREKTSPYEFYQYWRNIDDADVEKCFKLLTFLPLAEIAELIPETGENGFEKKINAAKARLAFEITKIIHGEADAMSAETESLAAFGSGSEENMPSAVIGKGIYKVADILVAVGFAKSKGEARRLIEGGGVKVGETKIEDVEAELSQTALKGGVILHKGKKAHVKISAK